MSRARAVEVGCKKGLKLNLSHLLPQARRSAKKLEYVIAEAAERDGQCHE